MMILIRQFFFSAQQHIKHFNCFCVIVIYAVLNVTQLHAFEPIVAGNVNALALQSDGKLLYGGRFVIVNGVVQRTIARSNSDGSLDPAFVSSLNFGEIVDAIVLQPDGKVLLGGNFAFNGPTVIRLNSDGSVDPTFNHVDNIPGKATALALQPDGKVLVGGTFGGVSTPMKGLMRLNSDGSVDQTFNADVEINYRAFALALQLDGKILVSGGFFDESFIFQSRILRLNFDGSVDQTFNADNQVGFFIEALALQSDGKVLFIEGGSSGNEMFTQNIVRLNVDGSVDQTFNQVEENAHFERGSLRPSGKALALQPDGKILIGRLAATPSIVRLNTDGSIDNTFSLNIAAENNMVNAIALQPDGKILVAGFFQGFDRLRNLNIVRLNSDGSVDTNRSSPPFCVPIISKNGNAVVVCL